MKASSTVLLVLAVSSLLSLVVHGAFTNFDFAGFHSDVDLITPQLLNQCDPLPNTQAHDMAAAMCARGHVLTTLAMALSSHHVSTFLNPLHEAYAKYSQYDLLDFLEQQQQQQQQPLTSQQLFPTTFDPITMIPLLSNNLHYTMSFTPLDLIGGSIDLDEKESTAQDNFIFDFCESVANAPALYLGTYSPSSLPQQSTIWLTHCTINDEMDDIILTAHHPLDGELTFYSFRSFAAAVPSLSQILISYTPYQQSVYSQWSLLTNPEVNHELREMTPRDYLALVFKRQSHSIYHPSFIQQHTSTSQLTSDPLDQWVIPHTYFISWKQGDYPNDIMTTKTVAQVGCLMCSVAVGLRNRNITLPGGIVVDPHTWNNFIKEHNGYDNDNFIHTTVNPICEGRETNCRSFYNEQDGRHPKNDLTVDEIVAILKEGKRHVVANVNGGRHFVPILGWSTTNPTRFKTFDSAGGTHGREWFDHSEIVGWRLYDLTGPYDF